MSDQRDSSEIIEKAKMATAVNRYQHLREKYKQQIIQKATKRLLSR